LPLAFTPVGWVLRRWSLDETPQFWNVLKGEILLKTIPAVLRGTGAS